jgi:CheY-like chemotaxis protein
MKEMTRVLVADDDESIRHLLCTLVKREKLVADCAADGLEAIGLLREHEYKVILLDLMMPRLDGFGVIEHLKNHPQQVKPIVLVITAYADQKFKEVDSSIVAGVIRKPFEVSEIGLLVRLCAAGAEDPERIRKMLESSRDRAVRDFLKLAHVNLRSGKGESGHTH